MIANWRKALNLTVLIASLGYFIDMFDLFLLNMVRVKSLSELGYQGAALTDAGLYIVNLQLLGVLLGSYLSGIFGDRYGRKACLFATILIYSAGSIASSAVQTVEQYAWARFFTGLGLAGELGQGLTLITEKLESRERGAGVLIFFSMGFLGVVAAGFATEHFHWRTVYIIGGVAGLCILLLRSNLQESALFSRSERESVRRGGLKIIFQRRDLFVPYLGAIFLVAPAVFTPQLLWTLAPELAVGFGVSGSVEAHVLIALGFSSFIIVDIAALYLSDVLKSRREGAIAFLTLSSFVFLYFILFHPKTVNEFYLFAILMAMTSGIWVIGLAWVSEYFATNIRATISATIPNFSRALAIPMNLSYAALKGYGTIFALSVIGSVVLLYSYIGWLTLKETYGKSLDFLER